MGHELFRGLHATIIGFFKNGYAAHIRMGIEKRRGGNSRILPGFSPDKMGSLDVSFHVPRAIHPTFYPPLEFRMNGKKFVQKDIAPFRIAAAQGFLPGLLGNLPAERPIVSENSIRLRAIEI